MPKFRKIVESILVNTPFVESEQKVNWILSQPKLVQALKNRIKTDSKTPENITPEQLLKKFDSHSIIIGKFLPWVVKMYIQGNFEYTDLGLINNYLENFTKSISKLDKKDINQYKSLNELQSALNSVKDIKGSREEKRNAKSGAEKIYEDNKWLILIPHTEKAAIQYGKGTRWCTAGINDNYFKYYNSIGPLYILINKQNPSEKYQFHFESKQFMNSEDHEINLKIFLKENPEISKFFRSIKNFDKSNYHNWIWLYDELTYKDYISGVKKNGWALEYVPEEFKDYNMCLEAVKNTSYVYKLLEYIPEKFKDYSMYLEAVKNTGKLLEYVPKKFKDYNMCLQAVKNTGWALEYVPEEFKDYTMYLETVKNTSWILEDVPEKFLDYNMCLETIKKNGWALKYVPEKFKDYNMCLQAVRNDDNALEYVPEEIKHKLK